MPRCASRGPSTSRTARWRLGRANPRSDRVWARARSRGGGRSPRARPASPWPCRRAPRRAQPLEEPRRSAGSPAGSRGPTARCSGPRRRPRARARGRRAARGTRGARAAPARHRRGDRRRDAAPRGAAVPSRGKPGGEVRRGDAARLEAADLILHQRDQGREDQRGALEQRRGELVAERFAAAGGRHQEHAAPGPSRASMASRWKPRKASMAKRSRRSARRGSGEVIGVVGRSTPRLRARRVPGEIARVSGCGAARPGGGAMAGGGRRGL